METSKQTRFSPAQARLSNCGSACLIAPIRAYQYLVSPWLGRCCRFEPSCSNYAIQALRAHGALKGTGLSLWRLSRCHPWQAGGYDPVPPSKTTTDNGVSEK